MQDPKFPILGADIPRLLGRESIMARIWSGLTKTTPSNLSLVGPRYVGKTVIMKALAQRAMDGGSPYAFVLPWHLGHVAPISDDDFIAQLCERLRDCLAASGKDTSDYRGYLENCSFAELREVTESMEAEGLAILMLWDGFDKPLGQGKLSVHLWDQMRTIFSGRRHKIVTATRKPLRELIRDAITSPFWNIFDMNPMRIQAFDHKDCDAIFGELPEYDFQAGAKTELHNWTSGFPPLFLGVLNQIIWDIPGGLVSNEAVNQAAGKAFGVLSDIIEDLWQDCPAGAKDLYSHLLDRGEISSPEAGRPEMACLLEKGFAESSGPKLTPACRMLQHHLQGQGQNTGSMGRLFGTWDDYKANIRGLLERRLALIPRFDDRLYRLVERAVADIPDYPDDCLNNLTGIRDCALQLIWQREFGPERCIPRELVAYWTMKTRSQHRLVKRMMDSDCWDIPIDPLDQIRLLSLLTGSYKDFASKAKAVSKDAYVLVDAIHNFRNRVQHPDGQPLHVGVAVAALMACLELLGCLARELES
ncbi:MAG: hypothetical protein C4519_28875 [Desulfobacteraceae bacterium]|nr:MAG: hypothetical protein C4519_28875 [Desulfobacteraceae bacterium]